MELKEQSLQELNLRKEKIKYAYLKNKNLESAKFRIALVLDHSGSMNDRYNNGTVQSIIEKILPIAMQFDDNNEMELWLFSSTSHKLGTINLENYYDYTKTNILGKYSMGGTNYSPVIRNVAKYYIEENPKEIPTFVIFITDDDNFDKPQSTEAIRALSHYPIFFQFIGIGKSCCSFLEKLDEIDGKYITNTGYFNIKNPEEIIDDQLYIKIFEKYSEWLEDSKVKEMIKTNETLLTAGIKQEIDYSKFTKHKKGFFGLFK